MQNRSPQVWLVLGDKAGDNAQATTLAAALGWPTEQRRLVFQAPYQHGKPRFQPSLDHLDYNLSDPLTPPWPDLVITVGRRPAMAALWVKQQSGGRTKVVLLGRPKGYFGRFDLVIVPAQYVVPPSDNVVRLTLPLLRVDRQAVAKAADAWRARLQVLPKPLIAVFVGGPTKPYRLDAEVARQLLKQAKAVVGEGTLYFSTSRRTPAEVVEVLAAVQSASVRLYRYRFDPPANNPHLALLELADACIVTADSISMLTEAIQFGKPVAVFSLPTGPFWHLKRRLLPITGGRDLEAFKRLCFAKGWAVPLEAGKLPYPPRQIELPDELPEVVQRVRALVEKSEDKGIYAAR